jgi:hypothetical protein
MLLTLCEELETTSPGMTTCRALLRVSVSDGRFAGGKIQYGLAGRNGSGSYERGGRIGT